MESTSRALHYLTAQDLMISAIEDIKSVVRCIELGATEYLTKSFNPVPLTARINNCIEQADYTAQETAYQQNIEEERRRADRILSALLPLDDLVYYLVAAQTRIGLGIALGLGRKNCRPSRSALFSRRVCCRAKGSRGPSRAENIKRRGGSDV
jgi:DNA-binding response OmpR family regulator